MRLKVNLKAVVSKGLIFFENLIQGENEASCYKKFCSFSISVQSRHF